MGRTTTTFRRAPVQIGQVSAAISQAQMLQEAGRTSPGAGGYGAREEARYGSVPLQLRIQAQSNPNSATGTQGVIPIGYTRRKRGLPPITSLPAPS